MIDEKMYIVLPEKRLYHVDERPYDPAKPRIKDLIWDHYDWLKKMDEEGKARKCVLDNCQKVLLCNTLYLGYDGFECPNCGNWNLVYRHCHSRFCTSCGVKTQKVLAAKAEEMCLDVKHRHIVFTIPEEYRLWFRKDRSSLNLLFIAARNTICKVTNENLYRKMKRKQKKSGKYRNDKDNTYLFRNYKDRNEFGMIATIHTFGRALNWNPHIHALVAELIYDSKKDAYREFHHFDYENLRKTWQYEINRLMKEHFGKPFNKVLRNNFSEYGDGLYVYAKSDKFDPEQDKKTNHSANIKGCINYMMRYASRPAMAESRLLSYDRKFHSVQWYYDDHKTEERIEVNESSLELLKKMIIHIPDDGFRTTRYYGFYNNKEQELLDHLHQMLGKVRNISRTKNDRRRSLRAKLNRLKYRTHCADTFNRDILKCHCGSTMVYFDSYNPLEGKHNDRFYRQSCIDEMRMLRIRRAGPS